MFFLKTVRGALRIEMLYQQGKSLLPWKQQRERERENTILSHISEHYCRIANFNNRSRPPSLFPSHLHSPRFTSHCDQCIFRRAHGIQMKEHGPSTNHTWSIHNLSLFFASLSPFLFLSLFQWFPSPSLTLYTPLSIPFSPYFPLAFNCMKAEVNVRLNEEMSEQDEAGSKCWVQMLKWYI